MLLRSKGSMPGARPRKIANQIFNVGLALDGELLQLSAFTSRGGAERAFGRIARPSRRR